MGAAEGVNRRLFAGCAGVARPPVGRHAGRMNRESNDLPDGADRAAHADHEEDGDASTPVVEPGGAPADSGFESREQLVAEVIEPLAELARLAAHDGGLRRVLGKLGRALVTLADEAGTRIDDAAAEQRSDADDVRTAGAAEGARTAGAAERARADGRDGDAGVAAGARRSAADEQSAPSLAEALDEAKERRREESSRQLAAAEAAHVRRLAEAEEGGRADGPPEVADDELPLVVRRCRLKAEGARWVIDRDRRLARGADPATEIEPLDRDLVARAKELPDCFLWLNPAGAPPAPHARIEDLAECFDALADALDAARSIGERRNEDSGHFERALDLVAEAQSALFGAVAAVWHHPDRDQRRAHWWLKRTAMSHGLLPMRHVRVDDPADATRWADLQARIAALHEEHDELRRAGRRRRSLLNRVRYHCERAQREADVSHDWKRIVESVTELVEDGMAPSNVELRELLLPLVDVVPDAGDDAPQPWRLVLREIDRWLATQAESAGAADAPAGAPPPELQQAADLLSGRKALLVGGVCRPGAKATLERELGLTELLWPDSHEHVSNDLFEPLIARPDVAVVLLAIRWSSHSFNEIRHSCDRHGKPLVRLPAGYGANQVALQVVEQASERLREG